MRPNDAPEYGEEEEWIKSLNSDIYPHLEYDSMNDFCRAINRKISARKNGAFTFNHSMEQRRIYISSPTENEVIHLNDNLIDVLGFKRDIIEGKSAGNISGMEHVIVAN